MNPFVDSVLQLSNKSVFNVLNSTISHSVENSIFSEEKMTSRDLSIQTQNIENFNVNTPPEILQNILFLFKTNSTEINSTYDSTNQVKISDLLLEQLEKVTMQSRLKNLFTLPELVQLTETVVEAFRMDYFEIDEDYTDILIMEKIASAMIYLANISNDSALVTRKELLFLEDKRSNLSSEKATIYEKVQGSTKAYYDCLSKIHGLTSKRQQIENDKNNYLAEAGKERKRIEEINEKQKKMEKWWWVPGYNLYLYFDAESAASNLEGILQRLHKAQDTLTILQKEEYALAQELIPLSATESKLDKSIFLIEQDLFESIDDINFTSSKIIQYAELTLFFGKLAQCFTYIDCNSRLVLEQLSSIRFNLNHLFKKGAIAERCTRFIQGFNYRGNAIYHGDKLNVGEYLASLNRRYAALMCYDHTLRIYTTEKCIGELEKNTFENIFSFEKGYLTTRKLILQDSGILENNTGGEGENFEGHILYRYIPVDTQVTENCSFFHVKSYNYSGTYVIKNENNLVLDVELISLEDNAPIITFSYHHGDNQKFVIERQPDLTYIIAAHHSKKVLSVNTQNRIVQSTWKDMDSQKWLILGNDERIVKFINIQSSKVMDIPMNSSAISTQLWTYPDNGTYAQKFKLARP